MVTITFHGGVNEIGGNKILINDETSVFLDFGKSFSKEKQFFEEPFIKARDESHLLELGILPCIKGLYEKEDETCDLGGVFISHPHTDHYDSIRFLKDCFPIHCGETAKNIILAREFSGQSIGEGYNLAKLTKTNGQEIFKNFKPFRTGNVVKDYSPIEIIPIHVDHSVPGAYGFIVKTSGGTIVYSGDMRMHGTKKSMSWDFIEKAKEAQPDVLIIEGTHIDSSKIESEDEVRVKVEQIVSQTTGLAMAGFAGADVDRLRTFYDIARSQGKRLAVSMKQAFLVHMLKDDPGLDLFKLNDPNIFIYQKNKKQTREYEKIIEANYSGNIIDAQEVNRLQNEIIMVASLFDMTEMTEIKPKSGSTYILSSSEPFEEEMEFSHDRLLNWLAHYGVPLYQAHASGHATPHELKRAIKEINPKKVYPVHTNRPELFKKFMSDIGIEIKLPVEGEIYTL